MKFDSDFTMHTKLFNFHQYLTNNSTLKI